MAPIYLDNAATTFPKPPQVAEAVMAQLVQGASVSRGAYSMARAAEELVYDARRLLCGLFGGPAPKNVVFTKNATEGLNVLLKGFLRPGDHILTSSVEHNAVMRPLAQLAKRGVAFDRVPCAPDGSLLPEEMEGLLRPNTRAVVVTHASNVCGTVLPLAEVGDFCKRNGLFFFVDAAQTAGLLPIHMGELGVDALAFTGHKCLYGPQGTGGLVVTDRVAERLEPLLSGGTGSFSHTEELPPLLPDRLEAGTPNLPGIAGLRAALLWLDERGIERLLAHELALTERFLAGLLPLEESGRVQLLGRRDRRDRVGVVSIGTPNADPARVAWDLDERYGIMVRVGLHCAPAAHKTLGTYPTGTIRFSFGWGSREEDVDAALEALTALL